MKKNLFSLCAAFVLASASVVSMAAVASSTAPTATAVARATTSAEARAFVCRNPETLRIAVIPQTKNQTAAGNYDALIDTLKRELGRNVALVPVGSYGAVVEGLLDGSVHLAELGPGSYAVARDRGADITAFASLHDQADATEPAVYRSALITRRDAGIQTLDELRGSAVSLVDPISTSGGIVPRAAVLRMTGVPLESWFGRVSFAGSHDLAIDAVLKGRVTAAFVADGRVQEAMRRGGDTAGALHIVWRSEPIPVDPFVYQTQLCEAVKGAIHRAFFQRQNALRGFLAWRGKQRFVKVSDADYD